MKYDFALQFALPGADASVNNLRNKMPTQECLSRVFQAVSGGFRVAYSALEAQSGAAARDDSMARLKSAYPQVTFASGEVVPTVAVDAPKEVAAAEVEEPSTRSRQKNR